MTDGASNSAGPDRPTASRAEIDALGEIIAATIALAVRTRSAAATSLLERALEALDARAVRGRGSDARREGFSSS